MPRPRVFLDIAHGGTPLGRITIELFPEQAPQASENFRLLCAGTAPAHTARDGASHPLHYKGSILHRVIPEFMLQGGDITARDGTGGASALPNITPAGGPFADENLGWRKIDAAGLVCMANRGPTTNTSQFFITLDEADFLTQKHTLFGHVVAGMDVVKKIADVKTGEKDRPVQDVVIENCGVLEFRKKAPMKVPDTVLEDGRITKWRTDREKSRERSRSRSRERTRSRDRKSRRDRDHDIDKARDRSRDRAGAAAASTAGRHRSRDFSRSRSRDRSGTRDREDRSHHHRRHHHRSHRHHDRDRDRDRDHPRRPRRRSHSPRSRSPSAARSPTSAAATAAAATAVSAVAAAAAAAAPPPSPPPRRRHRHRDRDRDRGYDYDREYGHDYDRNYDSEEEARIRREELERERERGRIDTGGEVKFKGRGSMKYREPRYRNGGGAEYGRLN